ncbi:rve-domain-containing protein, partial [Auricularia subglabra TFB-10046 SS5]
MTVDLKSDEHTFCEACVQAKQHTAPFPKASETEIKDIGDLTVSDVWGPAPTRSINGDRYLFTFTDGKTRHTVAYFGKTKDEALNHFKSYKILVKTQTGRDLKSLRSDGGGEYVNGSFRTFLNEHGIRHETTAPYSPSQNGISERLNRTIVERARAMLFAHELPRFLWAEAVSYATHLKNRSPTRALDGMTPTEAFTGRKPNVSHLHEFGIKIWVMVPRTKRTKLEPKAEEHIFTGVSDLSKAYRYWNQRTRQIQTSRNVTFDERT